LHGTISHRSFISWSGDHRSWHNVILTPERIQVIRISSTIWSSVVSGLLMLVSTDITVDVILGKGTVSLNVMLVSWNCDVGSWHNVVFIPEWREVTAGSVW
jgi:hypothetical protein